jgi:glycosyltransferase involved in cell wall biosynthesis
VRGAVVVRHGIEPRGTPDRAAARVRLGLDDRPVVLCFGFVAPYKGLEIAIDAARLAGPDVQLVIAGGAHPRMVESGYVAELADRGAGLVRFTGRVPDDEVATWFAAADVALFPYPKPFSSSGALALALALGTPVLLSPPLARCVGAPDALRAPADPAALSAVLRRLAGDGRDELLGELRTWTSLLAADRGWSVVADRHLEIYEEVSHVDRAAHRRLRAG